MSIVAAVHDAVAEGARGASSTFDADVVCVRMADAVDIAVEHSLQPPPAPRSK
jgi:hypothetical protein